MDSRILIIVIIFLLGFYGCNEENSIAYVDYEPKIVVEGFIENGSPAQVSLTWSASFNHELDTAYLLKHIIKSARVLVSDGVKSEYLTLGVNSNYLPPYVYYGKEIVGEINKTYDLKIEYDDKVIKGRTTIPEPTEIVDCRISRVSGDSCGNLTVLFLNTYNPNIYYQFATKVRGVETVYTPCLYGNIPSAQFGEKDSVLLELFKGPVLYPEVDLSPSFHVLDTVILKLRTQYKDSYDFWVSWQNEILNAQNPIFPACTNLKSNIEGAIGIWAGYGTSYYVCDGLSGDE